MLMSSWSASQVTLAHRSSTMHATFQLLFVASIASTAASLPNARWHSRAQRAENWSPALSLPPTAMLAHLTRSSAAPPNLTSVVSVLDFGAVGDFNVTDNTAAFTAALAAVAAQGGIVFVPAGGYMFLGTLVMPQGTSLVGTFTTVPAHDHSLRHDGSILLPKAGRGSTNGRPFVLVGVDCTFKGFSIYYPDVNPKIAPVPYPWTIQMLGDNAAVTDIELLNSWNGINATLAHRHYIARVQGQPVNIGIYVDATYDIGRIEDVHWNPWFSDDPAYIAWQSVYGTGFIFARTDWEYTLNSEYTDTAILLVPALVLPLYLSLRTHSYNLSYHMPFLRL